MAIIRNDSGIELNLILNANAGEPGTNLLMDVPEKYASFTHMALRDHARPRQLRRQRPKYRSSSAIRITVIELRGRQQGDIEGVTRYVP